MAAKKCWTGGPVESHQGIYYIFHKRVPAVEGGHGFHYITQEKGGANMPCGGKKGGKKKPPKK